MRFPCQTGRATSRAQHLAQPGKQIILRTIDGDVGHDAGKILQAKFVTQDRVWEACEPPVWGNLRPVTAQSIHLL